jgi:CheY-like chemotaxis protein
MKKDEVVLIVDDDEELRKVLAEILEFEGRQVVQAASGVGAMMRLREGLRPRLILINLQMRILDGEAFFEIRHSDSELARIPVILYSADGVRPPVAGSSPVRPVELTDLLSAADRFLR